MHYECSPRLLILLCFLLAFSVGCDPVSTTLAGKSARNVVEDARRAGNELMGQAERSGSALIGRSANELSVLAFNATQVLGDQLDKNVEKLSTEHRLLLEQLDQTRQAALEFKAGAFDLKDSLVLDLHRLFGDTWLSSGYSFLVQRIDGITQLRKPGGEYTLQLLGIGFGTDSDRLSSRVTEVTVDGVAVRFRESKTRAWLSQISISQPSLEPYFKEHSLALVPALVSVSVDRKTRLFGWNNSVHVLPLYLTLMPRSAGQVTVSYGGPKKDWVRTTEKEEYSYGTPDHHQEDDIRKFPYQDSRALEGDQRYVGPFTYRHEGEGCPWTEVTSLSVLENGKRLNLAVQVWGSPCTHFYGAAVEEYRVVGEYEGAKSYDLQFGQNLVVELPPDATYWRIQGRTSTLQEIDVINRGSDKVLTFKDLVDSGSVRRIVYQVAKPDGVS
jgi:hypothetical protein